MEKEHFYSKVAYTTPSWCNNSREKLLVNTDHFFTPGNSLQLQYVSNEKGNWEVKLSQPQYRGMDNFEAATHLSFYFMAPHLQNLSYLPQISMEKDSSTRSIPVKMEDYVTKNHKPGEWTQILIPLKAFNIEAENIGKIIFHQGENSSRENTIYLDQIELWQNNKKAIEVIQPKISKTTGFEKHVDISWEKVNSPDVKYIKIYRSENKKDFSPVGIQSPWISGYSDFTGSSGKNYSYKISFVYTNYEESPLSEINHAQTRQMSDEELLTMIQEANFRYYWDGAEPNSGLALENIPGRSTMIATGASGFGIMALIVGTDRGFISRQEFIERIGKIVDFLTKAEKFHGAFSHFIDGTTGKAVAFFGPVDNGGDLVETSFLLQGLLAAKQYLSTSEKVENSVIEAIDKIWKNVEWSWYLKEPDSDFLYWHWSPDYKWEINHKLIGWNETLITYFLSIASPTYSIPANKYYKGWASTSQEAVNYRKNWGQTEDGSNYVNNNVYYGLQLPVGVSKGGPLFFIHYSFLGLDPHKFSDKYVNYFENNKKIAKINYRYCVENPKDFQGYGPSNWGLSASDGPAHYSADEPVVWQDKGKITPTGALASFPYTPDESMSALKHQYREFGDFLYGYYGFHDSFILEQQWCSGIYMGLNQAPIAVMIENYRSGLIWDLFMKNPEVKKAISEIDKLK